jgi:2-polyprenyl-6-methoxyphenol hydroxylase-like FAD-dependent oxidoreductase
VKPLRIAIVGAGPAGLYAAILLRKARQDITVNVYERTNASATFGFGVVFSDTALDFLHADDPQTHGLITRRMERWSDIEVVHRGERIIIDGVGFSAIGRLELLTLLQTRARQLGAALHYDTEVSSIGALEPADLIIGADGINSVVRASSRAAFGETTELLSNHFAWFAADRPFERLTQTFVDSPYGPFNAHHYRYNGTQSTFIVECQPDTWKNAGLHEASANQSQSICENVFASALEGASLIQNNSIWRQFPILRNENWYYENRVLVGDALHTAHFSIGSGTRLALEDVMALVGALKSQSWIVPDAMAYYQSQRQPVVDKLVAAAHRSGAWYEKFSEYMNLAPWQFALGYIQRTGRINAERLGKLAPQFTKAMQERQLL